MDELICSAKGCRSESRWALRWRNPRIHDDARRKTWLACDQHREHLTQFLSARDFLKEVITVTELQQIEPSAGGQS